jgi:hypothetical protein
MQSCVVPCCSAVSWDATEQSCTTFAYVITQPGGTTDVATQYQPPPPPDTICPSFNNSMYTDARGHQYTIFCGISFTGNDLGQARYGEPVNGLAVVNLQTCVESCFGVETCVGVSWDSQTCSYKSVNRVGSSPDSTMKSAMMSFDYVTCDDWDGKLWTDRAGDQYTILCDTSFNAGSSCTSQPDFRTCIDSCDSSTGCAGVQFLEDGGNQDCCFASSGTAYSEETGISAAVLATTRTRIDCNTNPTPPPYIDIYGRMWQINCYTGNPGNSDMGSVRPSKGQGNWYYDIIVGFESCIGACSQISDCAIATWMVDTYQTTTLEYCVFSSTDGTNNNNYPPGVNSFLNAHLIE